MRLLLVEDDRMIGESLRSALRLENYAVDWVRDVAAAQATLASEHFDLVLLDLGLPASGVQGAEARPAGGLEVLRAVRA
ncbi:MAG: response regulator, partial [Pseudomonadota bacterium]|nr:response regulator [Pseudomonadota bacterium]